MTDRDFGKQARVLDHDPLTGITEYFEATETGFTIRTEQDVTPIIERNKGLQSLGRDHWKAQGEWRLEASIPIGVQYTSGTTSRPKGVLWTHANALWGAQVNAIHEDLRVEDVHLIFLPLFHTNALAYSLLATLWAGGTAVLMPRFSASRFWDVALKHRCTWTSLVPFCVKALIGVERPKRHHFRLGQRRLLARFRRGFRREDNRLVGHDRNDDARHGRLGASAEPADVDGAPGTGIRYCRRARRCYAGRTRGDRSPAGTGYCRPVAVSLVPA